MPTYTVHEPPLRKAKSLRETAPNPERFVFVRDGFYSWAFLFGPFWMLAHRLWIVLISYLVINFGIGVGLHLVNATSAMRSVAMLLVMLLVGFEAATLLRFGYRKWKTIGVVVADDTEEAERRFFSKWVERAPSPVMPTAKVPPMMRGAPSADHVIGLFPQPGGSR